jgi:hypothetical protein
LAPVKRSARHAGQSCAARLHRVLIQIRGILAPWRDDDLRSPWEPPCTATARARAVFLHPRRASSLPKASQPFWHAITGFWRVQTRMKLVSWVRWATSAPDDVTLGGRAGLRRLRLGPVRECVAALNDGFLPPLVKAPRHRPNINERTGYDCHLCVRGSRAPAHRPLSSDRIELA